MKKSNWFVVVIIDYYNFIIVIKCDKILSSPLRMHKNYTKKDVMTYVC